MILPDLTALVAEAAREELPNLIGQFEQAKAAAWARLAQPPRPVLETTEEPLLSPDEAVAILGGVSRRWLLRETRGLRFRRDFSRKTVRFEEAGLLRWIASRKA